MSTAPLLEQLIEALRCLPGVGQKSAQRMAYQLLERNRDAAVRLSKTLAEAAEKIGHCEQCRDFSETPVCQICLSASRDKHLLCVVETPADRLVIEQATGFRGFYFILQGRLSPLDGLGPKELGLDKLATRMAHGESLAAAGNHERGKRCGRRMSAGLASRNYSRPRSTSIPMRAPLFSRKNVAATKLFVAK